MSSFLVSAFCPGIARSFLPSRAARPLLALCLLASPLLANAGKPAAKGGIVRRVAPLLRPSLAFEPNVGQAAPAAKYVAHGSGFDVQVERQRTVLEFDPASIGKGPGKNAKAKPWRVTMQLAGASRNARLEASRKMRGTSSYFPSSDVKTWHANVPTYRRVSYGGLYPGIDLAFYGHQGRLEYDFTLASGANAHAIHLRMGGIGGASIDSKGDLLLKGDQRSATFLKPVAYQVLADGVTQRNVDVRYALGKSAKRGTVDVAFSVGAYDPARPLIIDPVLARPFTISEFR